jgi:hypothetical protein
VCHLDSTGIVEMTLVISASNGDFAKVKVGVKV